MSVFGLVNVDVTYVPYMDVAYVDVSYVDVANVDVAYVNVAYVDIIFKLKIHQFWGNFSIGGPGLQPLKL